MTDRRQRAWTVFQRGDRQQALRLLEALCADGAEADDWLALGRLRHQLGDLSGARAALERVLECQPDFIPAVVALAGVLVDQGEPESAYRLLTSLRTRLPDEPGLDLDIGISAELCGREAEALERYAAALRAAPDDRRARWNRARLLQRTGQIEQALADYAALPTDDVEAWHARAECLRKLAQSAAALAACERALDLNAGHVPSLMCKAVTLAIGGDTDGAQPCFDRAYALDPAAVARYGRSTAALPVPPDARAIHLYAAFAELTHAQWRGYDELVARARDWFADPGSAPSDLSVPFPSLYLPLAPREASAAHIAVTQTFAGVARERRPPVARGRLRLAYIATKFRDHPAMMLTAGLFAAHSRADFDVYAYALNPDDGSVERRRAAAEFDAFVDLSAQDDAEAARRIEADGIDILVDLNGYSDEARPGILARRPAGLQVSFIGHMHSLFAPWIDYRITDRASEPAAWGHPLPEARVFMKRALFPYGARPPDADAVVARASLGLPDGAFVMCAFTRVEKINPPCFALWMDAMRRVPHAILWLCGASKRAEQTLFEQAAAAGVDAGRLVFAPRAPHVEHLLRHTAADVYLDTFPFNGHTTGLDALHAGLPVVTLAGETWPSRIGASLLTSVGLPELIARTPDAYCERLVALAGDPNYLAKLKTRLRGIIATQSPFGPSRSARRLESAFRAMWARHAAGAAPADLDVDD